MGHQLIEREKHTVPTVAVIGLGGTIARMNSVPADETASGRRAVEALVTTVPEGLARLKITDLVRKSSSALTLTDLHSLAQALAEDLRAGVDGAVVIQGTDTLEETAYAIALMVEPRQPIIVTGSMRLGHEPGADGEENVVDAVRVAVERSAAMLGPLVTLSGEIHLARWVRKARTSGVHAFESAGFGPIGAIVEGNVHIWAAPLTEEYLGLPSSLDARVEIVVPEVGSDPTPFEVPLAGADGVVVAAMGGGHVPPDWGQALTGIARRGVPVVLASRTAAGPVLQSTYDGPGCEKQLIAAGLVPAGMLAPSKARLRLAVALSLGLKASEVFPHDARVSQRKVCPEGGCAGTRA